LALRSSASSQRQDRSELEKPKKPIGRVLDNGSIIGMLHGLRPPCFHG
jgi:hypothetical protein